MKLERQLIILGLLRQGRYKADPLTGQIVSRIAGRNKPLANFKNQAGYIQVGLDMGFNEKIQVYAHQIVYLSAFGVYDPTRVIDHINGIKDDNRLKNLRCITHAENVKDNFKNRGGKGSNKRRLSADEIQSIKELVLQGVSYVQIGKQFNVTRQTAKRVGAPDYQHNERLKITPDKLESLNALLSQDVPKMRIAEQLGVTYMTVLRYSKLCA